MVQGRVQIKAGGGAQSFAALDPVAAQAIGGEFGVELHAELPALRTRLEGLNRRVLIASEEDGCSGKSQHRILVTLQDIELTAGAGEDRAGKCRLCQVDPGISHFPPRRISSHRAAKRAGEELMAKTDAENRDVLFCEETQGFTELEDRGFRGIGVAGGASEDNGIRLQCPDSAVRVGGCHCREPGQDVRKIAKQWAKPISQDLLLRPIWRRFHVINQKRVHRWKLFKAVQTVNAPAASAIAPQGVGSAEAEGVDGGEGPGKETEREGQDSAEDEGLVRHVEDGEKLHDRVFGGEQAPG